MVSLGMTFVDPAYTGTKLTKRTRVAAVRFAYSLGLGFSERFRFSVGMVPLNIGARNRFWFHFLQTGSDGWVSSSGFWVSGKQGVMVPVSGSSLVPAPSWKTKTPNLGQVFWTSHQGQDLPKLIVLLCYLHRMT